jgi:SnoaL-like polyketide cyclase
MSRKSAIYIGFSSALSWLEGETNDAGNQQAHHPTITEELINTASVTLAAELIAPNASLYVPGMPEPLRGPSGFLSIVEMMRGGFPDIKWTLEDMVAEGRQGSRSLYNSGHTPEVVFWRSANGEVHRRAKHVVLPTSRWADC